MHKLNSSNSFSFTKNKKNVIQRLFERVSEAELKEHPEIKDAIKPRPLIFFEFLRQDKPLLKEEILNAQSRNKKHFKFLSQINDLRIIFNDCLKFQQKQKNKLAQVNKLTQDFCKDYEEYKEIEKKVQNNKSTLFDKLNAQYEKMNYKLPNIKYQSNRNAFRQNPLLIGKKNQLESYFKYHREPHVDSKAMKYIKRVDKIVAHRIMSNATNNINGNTNCQLSVDKNRQNTSVNNEKGLTDEILKYQLDIQSLYKSIDEVDSMDDFYTTKVKDRNIIKTPIQLNKKAIAIAKAKAKAKRHTSSFNKSTSINITTITRDSNQNEVLMTRRNKTLDLNARKDKFQIAMKKKLLTNTISDKKSPLESIYEESLNDNVNANKAPQSDLCEVIKDYFESNSINCESKVSNPVILKDFKKKKNVIIRNYIEEAFDIQRGKSVRIEYPVRQLKILDKKHKLEKSLCNSEKTFLKMIHDPELKP